MARVSAQPPQYRAPVAAACPVASCSVARARAASFLPPASPVASRAARRAHAAPALPHAAAGPPAAACMRAASALPWPSPATSSVAGRLHFGYQNRLFSGPPWSGSQESRVEVEFLHVSFFKTHLLFHTYHMRYCFYPSV